MKALATYAIMRAVNNVSLAVKLEYRLPPELNEFIREAANLALCLGQRLYLVGGMVRDLILDKPNLDLDLVVEGDAIVLARKLAAARSAKVTIHPRFSTAKVAWGGYSVDLATARSESYARPGALPAVKSGSIKDDLFRRDFTINAMALSLNADDYGALLDRYGGMRDIAAKLVRILYEKSFTDDATRIWRAIRYGERLDFHLEETTFKLLKRDLPILATISGERLRYELECVLSEEYPEKVLLSAGKLGVLRRLHPSLEADGWLTEKFVAARETTAPERPSFGLYFALLTYRLSPQGSDELVSCLRVPRSAARTAKDTQLIKERFTSLATPGLRRSEIYQALRDLSAAAVTAVSLATDSPLVRERLELYLRKLRYVKPSLNGNDLLALGMSQGPRIKEIIECLQTARLDGQVASKKEELDLVKSWL
jgi:tRNA nucleotidyltransferase (CCA-adding enzyme)